MNNNILKNKIFRKSLLSLLLCLALVVGALSVGFSGAYYTASLSADHRNIAAERVYFSSDILSESGGDYYVYNWTSGTTQTFKLYNYMNSAAFMSQNLNYSVAYSGITGGSVSISPTTGSINGGSAGESTITLTPTITGGNTEVSFTVTASTTNMYAKSISATFHFVTINTVGKWNVYDVANLSYSTLILELPAAFPSTSVTVAFNTTYVTLDPTDPAVASYSAGSATLTVAAGSRYEIKLFKSTPSATYDDNASNVITGVNPLSGTITKDTSLTL